MEEELRKIAQQLKAWAKKYKKGYVTMCVLDGNILANVETKDKDYNKLNILIEEEE